MQDRISYSLTNKNKFLLVNIKTKIKGEKILLMDIPQYKGTNIMHIRKRLQEAGQAKEDLYCSKLSKGDLTIYKQAVAAGWYPMDVVVRIFTEAAKILYAKQAKPFYALGYDQALDNLSGLYRTVLSGISPDSAVEQSARLWRTHFNSGEASWSSVQTEVPSQRKVTFIVKNYPQLPAPFLDIVEGYIHGIVAFTHAQFLGSKIESNNPQEWRWNWIYKLE